MNGTTTDNTTRLLDELNNMFTYHMAEGEQPLKYAAIRGQCLELAQLIVALCPAGKERAEAILRLNEVMFWANAAVARKLSDHAAQV